METRRFLMITTHFPPHHLGGDAQFVEYVSKELVARGHEVHVFYNPSVYGLLRGQRGTESVAPKDGIVRHPFSSRRRLEPLLALSLGIWGAATRKLGELEREIQPDVVHWHNPRGFIGRPFPFPGRVSLYTTHDYTPVCPRSNLMRPNLAVCEEARLCTICSMRWRKPPQIWRAGRRRVMLFPEELKVLSPSEFVGDRLRREGVKVHRILRGFVPDLGAGLPADRAPGDSIVYLGLIEQHKGVETLLEAFARSEDRQGFTLQIIGEGSLRGKLLERVRGLGLSERVRLPGFLSRREVEDVRRGACVQVVPSIWYENAPSVVLEAYSLGVPVLASHIGGLPEIVGPEAGSQTFRPGDAEGLARLLESLWDSMDELAELRRKARRTYETRFRPEVHISEYLKIIDGLQERDAAS